MKTHLKAWYRSGSWQFARDFLDDSRFAADRLATYHYRGHDIHYRPGSSDARLIYEILLKPGYKSHYFLPGTLQPEMILDIGGNIGIAAIYLAHCYPGAKIHTFEPVPDNFALLERNTAPYPAITAHHMALGQEDGSMTMAKAGRNFGGCSLARDAVSAAEGIRVTLRHTAHILAELGIEQADIIKIDTEGYEYPILTSMPESLLAHTTWIVGELHGCNDFKLLDYLEKWFFVDIKKTLNVSLANFHACNRSRLPSLQLSRRQIQQLQY
ncbi:MAG: FkbM family methyltransferase [Magnetococcus sp. XQGC-1]